MIQAVTHLHPGHLVRDATIDDVDPIYAMMESHAASGVLLPRSRAEICDSLMKFSVVEYSNETVACAALEIFTSQLCEIRSLVVVEHMNRSGFGRILVEELVEKARALGLKRIMALTYVPNFFHRLGFRTVRKEIFPEKVWGVCVKCHKFNDCDETAVVRELS